MRYILCVLMLAVCLVACVCNATQAAVATHGKAASTDSEVEKPNEDVLLSTETTDNSTKLIPHQESTLPGGGVGSVPGAQLPAESLENSAIVTEDSGIVQRGSVDSPSPVRQNPEENKTGNSLSTDMPINENTIETSALSSGLQGGTHGQIFQQLRVGNHSNTGSRSDTHYSKGGKVGNDNVPYLHLEKHDPKHHGTPRAVDRAGQPESVNELTSGRTKPSPDQLHSVRADGTHTYAEGLPQNGGPYAPHIPRDLQAINASKHSKHGAILGQHHNEIPTNMIPPSGLLARDKENSAKKNLLHKELNMEKEINTLNTAESKTPTEHKTNAEASPDVLEPTEPTAHSKPQTLTSPGDDNNVDSITSIPTVSNTLPLHHSVGNTDGSLGSSSLFALAALATLAVVAAAPAH